MRIWLITLIFAINAFAAQYGVLAVCTRDGGVDYCYVNESKYNALEFDGRLVIANGFSITRFVLEGKGTTLTNSTGTQVRHVTVKDETGEPYMLMESKNNLWIADTTGCLTMRYVKGGAENYRKAYKYVDVDNLDDVLYKVAVCRDKERM